MKKILAILIILLEFNLVYADNLTSLNAFPFLLEENEIPDNGENGNGGNGGGGGLDGGAVTAITLGSISVGSLGIIAYLLHKKYSKSGLCLNKVVGSKDPILSICMNKCSCNKFIGTHKDYPLLIKALKEQNIKPCPNSSYILIPDTELKNKYYDEYIFETPTELNNIKITQATENKNIKINYELFEDKTTEEKIKLHKIKENNGILMQFARKDNTKYGMLTVIHNNLKDNTTPQKYAIVIELSK